MQVKERPLPFSIPMVQALLRKENPKSQTRRKVKQSGTESPVQYPNPLYWGFGWDAQKSFKCPYGQVGDRLWVREPWRTDVSLDKWSGKKIESTCIEAGYKTAWAPIQYEADGFRRDWDDPTFQDEPNQPGRYRHARFMPRWASRITLEITDLRVERLQDISEADAKAEGADLECPQCGYSEEYKGRRIICPSSNCGLDELWAPAGFERLWESINGFDSWDANPWVWVIGFKRVEPA